MPYFGMRGFLIVHATNLAISLGGASYGLAEGVPQMTSGHLYCDLNNIDLPSDHIVLHEFCRYFAQHLNVEPHDGSVATADLSGLEANIPVFELSIERNNTIELSVIFSGGPVSDWKNGQETRSPIIKHTVMDANLRLSTLKPLMPVLKKSVGLNSVKMTNH